MKTILERISTQPLIFDGAMGTMIYSKGVFINTCYEHLCITNPKLIGGYPSGICRRRGGRD